MCIPITAFRSSLFFPVDDFAMRRLFALIFALSCLFVMAGCSDTSFVGKRVDNFTAYYNTYYNAEKSFEEGVEAVQDRRRSEPVDITVYLPLFLEAQNGNAEAFETAIEKSADVLREHPNSKWVDESLMLIGKSYYFQQNYVGAEQKFREVQDLGGELEEQARFWLVRTLVAADRPEEAERVSASLLTEEGQALGTWTARTWLSRGDAFVRQGRWNDAAEALTTGLSGDLPRRLRARGAFLLGQVRETLGDPSGARSAYDRSVDAANAYELVYAARLSSIRVQGLNGEPARALDRLEEMEEDDKNFERLAALRVLRARLLDAQGKAADAKSVLQDVLYEPPPAQGVTQGRAHYALGSLYRDAYDDFSRAAAHFDTAATSLRQPSSTSESLLLTPMAITNSESLGRRFRTIAQRASAVARMDSLLRLGDMSREELRAELEEIQAQQAEQRRAERERENQRAAARQFSNRNVVNQRSQSSQQLAASTGSTFLFHENPTRVQEGRRMFERQWGPRPRVDNWRRSAAIEQRQDSQAPDPDARNDGEAEAEAIADSPTDPPAGATPMLDVGEIPRTEADRKAMRADRAVAQYELATALFLNAERPDSAATWYRRIIEEDAQSSVAQRALYALAEVRTAEGRPEDARRLYQQVIEEYPNSVFAQRARQRLGRAEVEVADTTAVAEAAYAKAFRAWQDGERARAQVEMARVAQDHDSSTVAPRAILALASIAIDDLRGQESVEPDSVVMAFLRSDVVDSNIVKSGRDRLRGAIEESKPDTVASTPTTSSGGPTRGVPSRGRAPGQAGPPSDSTVQGGRRVPDPGRTYPPADSVDTERSDRSVPPDSMVNIDLLREQMNADSVEVDTSESTVHGGERVELEPDTSSISQPDSVSVRDTMAVPDTTTRSVVDSTARAYRPIVDVLAYLIERYPNSKEASRAEKLGVALATRFNVLPDEPSTRAEDAEEDAPDAPNARSQSRSQPANRMERSVRRDVRPDSSRTDTTGSRLERRQVRSSPYDDEPDRADAEIFRYDARRDSSRGRDTTGAPSPAPVDSTDAYD
ncbi:tetratricopeptide repeat protein [Longibacter salinarum]|uniref:type IX secretion system periplasmic lipoprotein PorW/SprE n=1 Tax=Longibacter salinarum TaxID=1850348 RepID=UPI00117F937F|nr:tetratricopeptide repeat protein [Longibacter salinarum]